MSSIGSDHDRTQGTAVRVAVLSEAGVVEVIHRADPEVLPGSVIVDIDRCGIGGPDIEAWRTGRLPAPAWFGHEWVGRVSAIGPGCRDRFEGERVVGAVPPSCGSCRPCRAGLGQHCSLVLAMIVGTDPIAGDHGAFAQRIRVDARRVHRVPEGIDDDAAAVAEPAAVAAHAVTRSGQRLGDLVMVVGAGTIGMLVAELARLAGAARVVAVDIEPSRRELACELGVDAAFPPGQEVVRWVNGQGHGLGVDVVYECAGRAEAVELAIGSVRQGGTIVVVGSSDEPSTVSAADLLAREVTVRASLGYTVADVHRALSLMADDRFRISAVTDRIIGFDGLADTLAELSSDGSARRKVLFSPNY